jgi:hypothetical protein
MTISRTTRSRRSRAIAWALGIALVVMVGAVVPGAAVAARADTPQKPSSTTTSVSDGVAVTAPNALEIEKAADGAIALSVDWPGTAQKDLHISWTYASSADSSTWTSVIGRWGAQSPSPGNLTIAAANADDWNGWYLRADISRFNGDRIVHSSVIPVVVVPVPDKTLPVDTTVVAGHGAEFQAAAADVYTRVYWERKAAASGSTWDLATAPASNARSFRASLSITAATAADNGALYRPVFVTASGIPHYGREATLRVRIPSTKTGLVYSTRSNAFAFYDSGSERPLTQNGVQTISGKTYFVAGGHIVLGLVHDPTLPGGAAYFSPVNGMVTNQFVAVGNWLYRFDGTGALVTTPGTQTIDGHTYEFRSDGKARQIVADYTMNNGGPGAIRFRIVALDNVWAGLQIDVATPGSLGGSGTARVTLGASSAIFRADGDAATTAKLVKSQLTLLGDQQQGSAVNLTIRRNGEQLFAKSYSLTCPANPNGPTPREIQHCPSTVDPLDPFLVQLNPGGGGDDPNASAELETAYQQALDQIANLSDDEMTAAIGAPAGPLRDDYNRFADGTTLSADTRSAAVRWEQIVLSRINLENNLVVPALDRYATTVTAIFDRRIDQAIANFNAEYPPAVESYLSELDEALRSHATERVDDEIAAIVYDLRASVIARMDRFTGEHAGEYLELAGQGFSLAVLNPDAVAPEDEAVLAHAQETEDQGMLTIDSIQDAWDARTDAMFDEYYGMIEVLGNAVTTEADGTINTFTRASLAAAAHAVAH